jgi:hypothetical protein
MRVQITYIASSGKSYNLISDGIRHRKANYHEWEWDPETTKLQYGERVAGWSKGPGAYETELQFYGSEKQRRELIDSLHDDFERDLRNNNPGRIIWGDYYLDCFIRKSSTAPDENHTWTANKIEIYAPYPFWMQEVDIQLAASQISGGGFLDYKYDYLYDYAAPVMGTKLVKSNFPFESEFIMIIYGQAVNPRIVINGYSYILYTTIPAGCYVVIDSRKRTITLYSGGNRTNLFNFRNKTDSIFKKIPGGNLTITWDSSFGADIKIFHERSEPRIEVAT